MVLTLIEKTKPICRPLAGNPKFKYLNPKGVKEDAVLKKQSQYVSGQNSAKSLVKGDYDNNSPVGDGENKANMPTFGRKFEILNSKSETTVFDRA